MIIPKSIQIGPLNFEVKVEPLHTPEGKSANGHTSLVNARIRIAEDMVERKQELTFCHELVHGMMEMAGLNARYDKDEQEELAASLAPVLFSVLTDLLKKRSNQS